MKTKNATTINRPPYEAGYPIAFTPKDHGYGAEQANANRQKTIFVLAPRIGIAAANLCDIQNVYLETRANPDFNGYEALVDEVWMPRVQEAAGAVRNQLVGYVGDVDSSQVLARSSDKVILALVQNKLVSLKEKENQHESQFKIWKEEFAIALESANLAGLPVDVQRARAILENIQFGMFDPDMKENAENTGAFYRREMGTTYFMAETFEGTNQQRAKEVVFHELLHAVAGQRITKESSSEPPEMRRSGLRSQNDPELKKIGQPQRFTWLDEAVTEQLALYLARPEETDTQKPSRVMDPNDFLLSSGLLLRGVYQPERLALMDLVVGAPNPDELLKNILGAYFEDYEPDGHEATVSRQPYRQAMFHTMSQHLNLARLDGTYRKHGEVEFKKEMRKQTSANESKTRNLTRLTRADMQRRRRMLRRKPRENTKRIIAEYRANKAA